jgi:hypothetical protein
MSDEQKQRISQKVLELALAHGRLHAILQQSFPRSSLTQGQTVANNTAVLELVLEIVPTSSNVSFLDDLHKLYSKTFWDAHHAALVEIQLQKSQPSEISETCHAIVYSIRSEG